MAYDFTQVENKNQGLTKMKLPSCGYQVFPAVVPEAMCKAVIHDIEYFVGYKGGTTDPISGLTEMYHYQRMWDIRQLPAVHDIFADVLGTPELWVSIDRVCRKTPFEPSRNPWPGFMHWDINPNQYPRPELVQGLVALADAEPNMGGFWCLPSLYQELDGWIASIHKKKVLQSHFNVFNGLAWHDQTTNMKWQDGWSIECVPMKVGDLLIWDSFLPHGNGPNMSRNIRYAQYVTMSHRGDERDKRERIECFMRNTPPPSLAFFGDANDMTRANDTVLSDLGQSLLCGMTPKVHPQTKPANVPDTSPTSSPTSLMRKIPHPEHETFQKRLSAAFNRRFGHRWEDDETLQDAWIEASGAWLAESRHDH